ncbi:bacteriohemerythrin [Oryzomonas japonica]|uniref:Bacteriohemerythrin n=1 Tax=Oryzomonas japonica TaxID=2603858 RepID=A0A7J4ZNC5_9BACT|nr:bacteriohemerythrin [Oryzomonas japonica]KAB0664209.1 bacteriohemerythrin [Oryzomonas japonica]
MSFIVRVIIGNTIVILLGVTAMVTLNTGNALWLDILFGLAMVAATSLVLGIISSRTFSPLAGLVAALEKAAGGDLSVRAEVTGDGELGRLAVAFNSMMTDMNKAMRQFFSVADLVRDSVEMVSSTTHSMALAAEDVAQQASTIATASEEMSATSGDIARNCLFAAENAQKATDQTHSGAQLVQNSARLMDNIAQRVNESSTTVEGLGQRSDQIGAIVNTIQDIADQTNLLALNAAIEAARAGEQGRGFAVVADEVRALAERTTKATKEISTMIKSIQEETQAAVGSMSEGVGEVKRGTAETTRSGEALEDILNKINDLTMQVSQIATAAEEQTATTQEITNNIQMITDVVNGNVENARSTTAATGKLASQVDELHQLVGHFRLAKVMEWDSSFATGVSQFDQQHIKLFDMVNELHDAMQQKRSKEAIGSILGRLIEYTASHFGAEEDAFRTSGYHEAAQHKQHHTKLVDQVLDLQRKFNAGETLLTQDVIMFLQDWLINHIKGVDRKYGPHLTASGIK